MTISEIIDNDYCIGCGACASVDSSFEIGFDQFGRYQANVEKASENSVQEVLDVCPFSNSGDNEDAIAEALYGESCSHDGELGYYDGLYAGCVVEGDFRSAGSSGGVLTWICCELLNLGLADYVLHVKEDSGNSKEKIFSYAVSSTPAEVREGAKSRYYPVEMSEVLKIVAQKPGRYILVALPCFVKAVRRLMGVNQIFKDRIVYCVGLVCGHLKSKAFADCFAWQKGIKPGRLEHVDFRVKLPGRKAGDYGVFLSGDGKESTQPNRELLGHNWGHNFFRYPACSYCDDVFAETADVVVGDAWLSQYASDSKGNSVVVVRNRKIKAIVDQGIADKRLRLNEEPVDVIVSSQAGGLRDRREGLAYRLFLRKKAKSPCPEKRVPASGHNAPLIRRQVYRMRLRLEKASHTYWEQAVARDDLEFFRTKMGRLIFFNGLLWCNLSRLLVAKARGALRRFRGLLKRSS